MPLHGSTIWKRRHSTSTKPVIHRAYIPRLFHLLESSDPIINPYPNLMIERSDPSDSKTHCKYTPGWSPRTPSARMPASWPGTGTSNKALSWSPITPLAPPLAGPPAKLAAQWPPITSPPPPAALTLAEPAIFPVTAMNERAALQQMLVTVYGEAAFLLLSLADWETDVCVQLAFEELAVHPALANSPRLPGLTALGLDALFEVGQMDFFTWRGLLFGPRYAHAGIVEGSESVKSVEDAGSGGVGGAVGVREEEDESEDVFAGEIDVTGERDLMVN